MARIKPVRQGSGGRDEPDRNDRGRGACLGRDILRCGFLFEIAGSINPFLLQGAGRTPQEHVRRDA